MFREKGPKEGGHCFFVNMLGLSSTQCRPSPVVHIMFRSRCKALLFTSNMFAEKVNKYSTILNVA